MNCHIAQTGPPQRGDAVLRVGDAESPLAQCVVWWNPSLQLDGESLGLIGQYRAENDDAARALLTSACGLLTRHGCARAVGPMDGDTWHAYRFVTDPGDGDRFLMEPWNPPDWPRQFTEHGFSELARYFSAVNDDFSRVDGRMDRVRRRMDARGVTVRAIDPDDMESELRGIFGTCLDAFRGNFLYSPIDEDTFLSLYLPARPLVVPGLVLVAEQDGRNVGFVFALPDTESGEAPRRIVVKTLAARPGRALAGLGGLLLEEVHRNAVRLGFDAAVHALMHESNESLNLSARTARVIRRYALFQKPLTQP